MNLLLKHLKTSLLMMLEERKLLLNLLKRKSLLLKKKRNRNLKRKNRNPWKQRKMILQLLISVDLSQQVRLLVVSLSKGAFHSNKSKEPVQEVVSSNPILKITLPLQQLQLQPPRQAHPERLQGKGTPTFH